MLRAPEVRYLEGIASTSIAEEAGLGSQPCLGCYRVSYEDVAVGSTLGSPRAVCVIKATGAIEKIYCVDAGSSLIGTFLLQHWETGSGARIERLPGTFGFHPDYQDHIYVLENGVAVTESIFALNRAPEDDRIDPAAAYVLVTYRNTLDTPTEMDAYAFFDLSGDRNETQIDARFERRFGGILAWNRKERDLCRFVGSSIAPEDWETTCDRGKAVGNRAPGKLACAVEPRGSLGILRVRRRLPPEKTVRWWFTLAVSAHGTHRLLADVRNAPGAIEALNDTRAYFHSALETAQVMTPNINVNRGVTWSKANVMRVLLTTPTGRGFTNDPTRSSKAVARDTAFFSEGSGYIVPDFTRESLLRFVERQKKNGMMVEWYDMLSNQTSDYGLNINDDTPLLVLALVHYAQRSGDRAFLERTYPAAKKAAEYILSQRDRRGLVWCTSQKRGTEGIAGWRNVIPGYRISGASTELNSECYGALRALAKMARALGLQDDAARFDAEADALRVAINEHLVNPENGLYLLAIDVDETRRTEISSDLVFPVLHGVADEDRAERITRRLSAADFWTEAGIRTAPHDAPEYSPDHGSGLLGGVWVGVSFWYATCAAHFLPGKMEEALATTFLNYSRDPRRSNTVPGQFSEWLHGETLVNQGMMLSPWFPPRYLWAAVEGAAGFHPDFERASLAPRIPPDWHWIAGRNVPFHGRKLSWFVIRTCGRLHVFSNYDFETKLGLTRFEDDVTNCVSTTGEHLSIMALRDAERTLVFVGSSSPRSVTTRIRVRDLAVSRIRSFEGLAERWSEEERGDPKVLADGYVVSIGPRAYQLLELRS